MQRGDKSSIRILRRVLGLCLVILSLTGYFAYAPASPESRVWIVDPDPQAGDCNTIWEAVLFASPGDTIRVNPGTYRESVDVPIPLIVEGSAEGDTIVETKREYGFKINQPGSGTTIRSFMIHCSTVRHKGIVLERVREATVSNNRISGCHAGILLDNSIGNRILENTFSENPYFGIKLDQSNQNEIVGNTCLGSSAGINLWESVGNELSQNALSENGDGISLGNGADDNLLHTNIVDKNGYGIVLYPGATHNVIRDNEARGNSMGIYLNSIEDLSTEYNTVSNNRVLNNTWNGIGIGSSHHNSISHNQVVGNWKAGIGMWASTGNELVGNIIHGNRDAGISIYGASQNLVRSNDIRENKLTGIMVGGSSKENVITQNNIAENLRYGLTNWTDRETVNAQENWWGDPSGPYHENENRSGRGDEITGGKVLFRPWLEEPVAIQQEGG